MVKYSQHVSRVQLTCTASQTRHFFPNFRNSRESPPTPTAHSDAPPTSPPFSAAAASSIMNSLSFTPLSTASFSSKSKLKPLRTHNHYSFVNLHQKRGIRNGKCKAELSHEAPFVVAIGACMLNSLVFPVPAGPNDDEDGGSVIDSADARFAVMGIIGFIPYFNWMSWVFAWMDTGKRRYAVYALVYLAPYLRLNLSLSPEESWLPIASILLCIIHIQVEASIKNGDLQAFQLFKEVSSNASQKKDITTPEQGRRKDEKTLPHAHDDESRNEIKGWGVPRNPAHEPDYLNEEGEAGEAGKKPDR